MIGYYNYTVILTYLGTLSGFIGVTYLWSGNLNASLICLLISGCCDMFDGKVASTMKRTHRECRFGIQIDSLSDLICFGLLPALIILSCNDGQPVSVLASSLYLLCALIRLAWFNVDEDERQKNENGRREIYLGLPVTTAALIFPLTIGACELFAASTDKISLIALLITGAGFLTPFSMKKPTNKGNVILLICGVIALLILITGKVE